MVNKRILYLSYDGMTDPLGQSQVLPYLAGLSKLGYSFSIVSCEKPDALQKRKQVIQAICEESGIDWYPLPYTKKPPVISTILDLKRMIRCASGILSDKKHDIIHCRGHYITSMVAISLLKEHPIKYIFDMRGFWADERTDAGLWPKNHLVYGLIYRYFKRQEIIFLNRADVVITLTEAAKLELESWPNIHGLQNKIVVIPCCADLNLFNYEKFGGQDKAILREKYNIGQNTFVLGYLGSLGTWYLLEEMIKFFKLVLKDNPDSCFLLVTNDYPGYLSELLQEYSIPVSNVIVASVSREQVPHYLSIFDVGIFFIAPFWSKKGSSPVKHGEMMGMGIPLICNANVGDMERIVNSTHTGHVIRAFNETELKQAVDALDGLRSIPKENIRNAAYKYYDLNGGIQKYKDIYESI